MKKLFAVVMLLFAGQSVFSQVTDPGFSLSTPDTTVIDSNAAPTEDQKPGSPIDPALRPYEKIVLNVDSITNLITYFAVIEQEESGSDSLYSRAKRWTNKNLKDLKVEVDKRNQKLVYIGTIPAYSYTSKYAKTDIGKFEFKLTFLIKEGRYKFQITNLVHESVKPSGGGKTTRNYFEYYYTSTTRVRENDIILRNANRDILRMMENIKNNLKEPKMVDEDDW